ncbi:MAG: hypothetical protein ACXITV_09255 [Luteibaculaceae bacterium]
MRYAIVLSIGLFLTITLNAQTAHKNQGDFSLNFALGMPTGAFSENLSNTPIGLNTSLAVGRKIKFGVDYTYALLGGERVRRDLNIAGTGPTPIEVRTNSNLNHFQLFTRFSTPTHKKLNAYADILGGLSYFSTRTVVEDRFLGVELGRNRESEDVGLIWGARVGARYKIAKDNDIPIYINLHVTYINGSAVEFADPKTIQFGENDVPNFENLKSRTNILFFNLGFSMILN